MGRKFIDHAGKTFGKWAALSYAGNRYWHCRCSCGVEQDVKSGMLVGGRSTRCLGCAALHQTVHGHAKGGGRGSGKSSPEYMIYTGMRQRCTNPNVKSYPDYGGRGIEFRFTSFEQFFAEVGPRPLPHAIEGVYTIDRKEVNGHYEPGNVQWATRREQNQPGKRRRPNK